MVRNYIKKRTKPEFLEEDMQRAIHSVQRGELSLRKASQVYSVTHTALYYRLKKLSSNEQKNKVEAETFSSKHTFRQVFSNKQEELLVEYSLACARMNYGLTYQMLRTLAHDYALKLARNLPNSWIENKQAGVDWVQGFMKRHPELSLRKPENTSLTRATSFHRANVETFFDTYSRALQKYPFTASRIFNLDETGVMTVVQAPNVIAERGVKQVGQSVSGERGTLVTMVGIISASGNTIPPVFIFPRARFHDTFMNGSPPGSIGLVNSPSSGWMTAQLFLQTLKHVVNHTKCTKQDPILIVMDNHKSHCSLEAILYARDNGIIIVTFPPHCSHRLQPLDVSVFGPFKGKYKIASNDWMISHPGKTITIHNIAELAGKAFENSFTMKNILSGFRKTGLFPLDRNIFTDEDFDPSSVTDRLPPDGQLPMSSNDIWSPQQIEEPSTSSNIISEQSKFNKHVDFTEKSTNTFSSHRVEPHFSGATNVVLPAPAISDGIPHCADSASVISPEVVRPFPKAPARSENYRGRRKGRSKILTETPEKEALEQEMIEKTTSKQKKNVMKKVFDVVESKKINSKLTSTKKMIKNRVVQKEDTSDDSDTFSTRDDSDDLMSEQDTDSDLADEVEYQNLSVNDFVLVKFCTKKTVVHYVGLIKQKK